MSITVADIFQIAQCEGTEFFLKGKQAMKDLTTTHFAAILITAAMIGTHPCIAQTGSNAVTLRITVSSSIDDPCSKELICGKPPAPQAFTRPGFPGVPPSQSTAGSIKQV